MYWGKSPAVNHQAETQTQNLLNTNGTTVRFGAHTIAQNRAIWTDAKTLAERGKAASEGKQARQDQPRNYVAPSCDV
jgi:hypothetical protein